MINIKIVEKNIGELFSFEKKSKIKAGEGKSSGKYKFFTSSNIQDKFYDEYLFEKESLIFGTGGNPSIHYCNEQFSTSTDCFVIYLKEKNILIKYVYYYLINNMNLLEKGFKGAGIKHISKKYLQSITIPYPDDINIQRNIVDKLTEIEKIINYREKSIEIIEKYQKSIFYKIFGDPIINNYNWEQKPLKLFGEIKTGNTPPRKDPENYGDYIEWIKSDNINTPEMYLTKSEEYLSKIGYEKGRIVPPKSVLVTCIAGSINCLGNVGITNREVAFNQQINAIVPDAETNEIFLYYLILFSKKYIQTFTNNALKGCINKTKFGNIKLIKPPLEKQEEFSKRIKEIDKIKQNQIKSKKYLQKLFNMELNEAMKC